LQDKVYPANFKIELRFKVPGDNSSGTRPLKEEEGEGAME
jgi:hypothetical protein